MGPDVTQLLFQIDNNVDVESRVFDAASTGSITARAADDPTFTDVVVERFVHVAMYPKVRLLGQLVKAGGVGGVGRRRAVLPGDGEQRQRHVDDASMLGAGGRRTN